MMTMVLADGREIPVNHPGGGFRPFKGDRLVKLRLYGELAKVAGRDLWELAVSSVGEAINALHHLTQGATTKFLADTNDTIRWRVLVNDHVIDGSKPGVADELMIERDVESIDIYPVMEGAGGSSILEAIFGAILIIAAIVITIIFPPTGIAFGSLTWGTIAGMLVIAGIAAVLGGLVGLMSTPGKTKAQKASKGNPSYLFSGTVNTQDQGGPVPVAYGNVIIGSQTISAYVLNSDVYQLLGGNISYQLPNPYMLTASKSSKDAVSGHAVAMSEYWQALGPSGLWGYFTGVSIVPSTPDVPVLQEPAGLYPNGPDWLVRFDNGSLGASYDPGGNAGPWETLWNAPAELDSIIVTQATDTYGSWEPTPNLA